MPRAMAAVCSGVTSSTEGCKFSITMSVVEIYCEKVRDLLDPGSENLQVQCLCMFRSLRNGKRHSAWPCMESSSTSCIAYNHVQGAIKELAAAIKAEAVGCIMMPSQMNIFLSEQKSQGVHPRPMPGSNHPSVQPVDIIPMKLSQAIL